MATLPQYRTWVAGEVVTDSELNSNVRDAGNFWLARPLAILRQTVIQSVPNATFTDILLDTEDIDRDGGHSIVTNTARYTSPTSGYLMFAGAVIFAANATGGRITRWALNATGVNGGMAAIPAITGLFSYVGAQTVFVPMNGSTDYVTLQGYQNSGGALNTSVAAPDQSSVRVLWVSTL